MPPKRYRLVGLMSGSSLDGLDLVCCRFDIQRVDSPADIPIQILDWQLEAAVCLPYPKEWVQRLKALPEANAREFVVANVEYGRFLGEQVRAFVEGLEHVPQAVVSHGHTIFHFPEQRCTVQLGDGAALAAACGLPVISDCRSTDVAMGGQGTPLAPLADRFLYPGYDAYLNLGGIANVSVPDAAGHWRAWDVGPANQILNKLAQEIGQEYDAGGELARSGLLHPGLLAQVAALPYFRQPAPKSLDNTWIAQNVWPLYRDFPASIEDKLHTACAQLVLQLKKDLGELGPRASLLLSGGGALNTYLTEQIRTVFPALVIPDADVVEYKEAVLMALVGLLRLEELPNCMHRVTGAAADTINGALYTKPTLHG